MAPKPPTSLPEPFVDPVRFCESLVNPETGELFVLTEAEKTFLTHAFTLDSDGRLLYPELTFSGPKKPAKPVSPPWSRCSWCWSWAGGSPRATAL